MVLKIKRAETDVFAFCSINRVKNNAYKTFKKLITSAHIKLHYAALKGNVFQPNRTGTGNAFFAALIKNFSRIAGVDDQLVVAQHSCDVVMFGGLAGCVVKYRR